MALLALALVLVGCERSIANSSDPKSQPQPKDPSSPVATGFIEKFEVPERDEKGNLKWKLLGDRAQIRADGLIAVFNARAEFFTSNQVEMVFSSPTCLLDRDNKRATTEAPVTITRANMVLTGNGADWVDATTTLMIHRNVRLVITNSASMFQSPPKQGAK